MDQKSNGEKPKNVDLPDHNNEFWPEDAQNYTFKTKQVSCSSRHNFEMTKQANNVKCNECGVGYYLSPGMELKDGHIYFKGNIVI